MELALALGMTVATLKASMDEREFVMWQHYAAKRFLPARRFEYYMAQVTQSTRGGTLTDHLLDRLTTKDGQDVIETIVAVTGSGIKKLGQGRAPKEVQ